MEPVRSTSLPRERKVLPYAALKLVRAADCERGRKGEGIDETGGWKGHERKKKERMDEEGGWRGRREGYAGLVACRWFRRDMVGK